MNIWIDNFSAVRGCEKRNGFVGFAVKYIKRVDNSVKLGSDLFAV